MKSFTKFFCFTIALLLVASFQMNAQPVSFFNNNAALAATTHSGCSTAVVDINGDGLDDIARLDQGHDLYIDYQIPGQQFSHVHIGDFGGSSGEAWGMVVGDIDANGYKDVLAGPIGNNVEIYKLNSTGTGGTLINLPASSFFMQNANFMDVDGDGDEDVFVCDDNAESHIWVNDGSGNFTVSNIINFDVTNTDDSGNYGSLWTDFDNDNDIDFYIAKCRQGVTNAGDGRRIDVLFVNDGNNNYTSAAAAYGLADSGETWTCNFGDIDNDGDLDAIQTDQDVPAKLLLNDGTGHMTNISAGSGFTLGIFNIESMMEDFDNDGYLDILVTGDFAEFFHNNHNHTFTKFTNIFTGNMESFSTGDLNHDGQIDVYGSYASIYTTPTGAPDIYWLNNTNNGNHFITFNLIGTVSNTDALGARVTLYGSFGKQVREVRAGESYGTSNSMNLHFGLGTATSIDSAVIRFPSGIHQTLVNPNVDQFITVKENGCVSPALNITSSTGAFVLCTGQSLTLDASNLPAGYSYLWSNGSTATSITVNTTGSYYVTAVSQNGECSNTAAGAIVTQNPNETPTVAAAGDLTFCQGGSVVLTSSAASGYTWSNGATTQSITVTQSGSYTVTTDGACQQWTSSPITVTATTSVAPTANDVYIAVPGTATLTSSGTDIEWFDVATGGSSIATGNTFNTPFLNATTTYYAESEEHQGTIDVHGGMPNSNGMYSGGSGTNAHELFDVYAPCVLHTVKITTDMPGLRIMELWDAYGGLVQSVPIDVQNGANVMTVDINLTPGSFYLTTNAAQNNNLLGTDAPHLERNNTGVNYPYDISTLLSITGSDQGSDYYYYFYDWDVTSTSTVCVSDRDPATVFVATGIQNVASDMNLDLFPNPSEGLVTIKSDATIGGTITLNLVDVTGKTLLTQVKDGMNKNEILQLDLSAIAKGIYFLNVQTGSGTIQHKVVIQ